MIEPETNQKMKLPAKMYVKDPLIKKCSTCAMCREECPTYAISESESFYAGGRLRVLRTFSEKNLPMGKDFIRAMFFCTNCKMCEEICPLSMEYVSVIEKLRQCIVTKNPCRNDLTRFARNVQNNKNPYGEPISARSKWIPDSLNVVLKGQIAYFVGCTGAYRNWEVARNSAQILGKILKEGVVLLGPEEYCCGSPLIRTGQIHFKFPEKVPTAEFNVGNLIAHNIETLVSRGVREVIFSCAGCYKTASEDWPRFYSKQMPFAMHHITEIIAQKVQEGKIKFKPWYVKITYHDPCHLGRFMGVYEAPRIILRAIPGVELVEMRKNRNLSHCCGAGGGVKASFPAQAIEMAKIRVKEAVETGAQFLVTSCVFCENNFRDAIESEHISIQLRSLEEIVLNLLE